MADTSGYRYNNIFIHRDMADTEIWLIHPDIVTIISSCVHRDMADTSGYRYNNIFMCTQRYG